mmetsp:Transcript_15352/g.22656  ORF Transcript_15352/g.22656 Transcript_15352/m.22656 type:complete len:348 (-) Transcript_15352:191-1234(-)
MGDFDDTISVEDNAMAGAFSVNSALQERGGESLSEEQTLIVNGMKKIRDLDKALKQRERLYSLNQSIVNENLSKLCIADEKDDLSRTECVEGKLDEGGFFLTETSSIGNNTATTSSITEGNTTDECGTLYNGNNSAFADAIPVVGSLVARNRELLGKSRTSSLTTQEEARVEFLLNLDLDEVNSSKLNQGVDDASQNILNFGGYELTCRLKDVDAQLLNDFGAVIDDYDEDNANDVLRMNARKREFARKQRNIDEALSLLEDAPIPIVVRTRIEEVQEETDANTMFPKYFNEEDIRNVLHGAKLELKEKGENVIVGDNDTLLRHLLFELGEEVEAQVMENKRSSPDQ